MPPRRRMTPIACLPMNLLLWIVFWLLLALVVAAMVVPITVLVWWAGWSRRTEGQGKDLRPHAP